MSTLAASLATDRAAHSWNSRSVSATGFDNNSFTGSKITLHSAYWDGSSWVLGNTSCTWVVFGR